MNSDFLQFETTTNKLTCRRFGVTDAYALFALIDHNREHLSQHDDDTANKYPALGDVVESITRPKNPRRQRYGIWNENGALIGSVNLTPVDGDEGVAEIGYWIGQEFTGQGYATAAAQGMINYGFEQGFARIIALAHITNLPSQHVLSKAGMVCEGTDTLEHDFLVYSITSQAE